MISLEYKLRLPTELCFVSSVNKYCPTWNTQFDFVRTYAGIFYRMLEERSYETAKTR